MIVFMTLFTVLSSAHDLPSDYVIEKNVFYVTLIIMWPCLRSRRCSQFCPLQAPPVPLTTSERATLSTARAPVTTGTPLAQRYGEFHKAHLVWCSVTSDAVTMVTRTSVKSSGVTGSSGARTSHYRWHVSWVVSLVVMFFSVFFGTDSS